MGQYYKIVNVDKRQFLRPHAFGDGAKLLEWGCSSNGTLTALAMLLASGNGRGGGDLASHDPLVGSWAGDRVVVAGDYADGDFVSDEDMREVLASYGDPGGSAGDVNLYTVAGERFADISADALRVICADSWVRQRYDGPSSAGQSVVVCEGACYRITPAILRLVQGLRGKHQIPEAGPGDWVWRLRPLYEGRVVLGSAMVAEDVTYFADHIMAESPDDREGTGWAIDRVQLKESDFVNGELREFDGF
jgi:hypothetical protein